MAVTLATVLNQIVKSTETPKTNLIDWFNSCLTQELAEATTEENDGAVTALMMACDKGQPTIAKLLLKNNADPWKTMLVTGNRPAHFAAQSGHVETLEILALHVDKKLGGCLVSGPLSMNKNNDSPLMIAIVSGSEDAFDWIIDRAKIELNRIHPGSVQQNDKKQDLQAWVNGVNNTGDTALTLALLHGRERMISVLFKTEASPFPIQHKQTILSSDKKHKTLTTGINEFYSLPQADFSKDPLKVAQWAVQKSSKASIEVQGLCLRCRGLIEGRRDDFTSLAETRAEEMWEEGGTLDIRDKQQKKNNKKKHKKKSKKTSDEIVSSQMKPVLLSKTEVEEVGNVEDQSIADKDKEIDHSGWVEVKSRRKLKQDRTVTPSNESSSSLVERAKQRDHSVDSMNEAFPKQKLCEEELHRLFHSIIVDTFYSPKADRNHEGCNQIDNNELDDDISEQINSLGLEPRMLLLRATAMALECSPSQLEYIDQILISRTEAVQEAKLIQARVTAALEAQARAQSEDSSDSE